MLIYERLQSDLSPTQPVSAEPVEGIPRMDCLAFSAEIAFSRRFESG